VGPIGDRHHCLQPAQITIRAPILGQLHAGPLQLVREALQLRLQAFQQSEGVGRGAGEPGENAVIGADPAHFAGVPLHHRLAHRHLAIAGHGHPPAVADA
jgi:hypothetical protein